MHESLPNRNYSQASHMRKRDPELKNPKLAVKKMMKEDRKLLQIEIPIFH